MKSIHLLNTLLYEKVRSGDPDMNIGSLFYGTTIKMRRNLAIMYFRNAHASCGDWKEVDSMVGTDYRHPTDVNGILERVKRLPEDQSRAILGGNAEKLFNLGSVATSSKQ
jgi:hypothetical protein